MYQLYAVAVHLNMTNAAYSGHYISYVKDLHGEWFKIDDSRVCSILTHISWSKFKFWNAKRPVQFPSSEIEILLVWLRKSFFV